MFVLLVLGFETVEGRGLRVWKKTKFVERPFFSVQCFTLGFEGVLCEG